MTDLVDELGFEAFQLDEEERNYLEELIQQECIAMLTEAVRKAERGAILGWCGHFRHMVQIWAM